MQNGLDFVVGEFDATFIFEVFNKKRTIFGLIVVVDNLAISCI